MVIRESVDGVRVMQQNVRIENVVLDTRSSAVEWFRRRRSARLFGRVLKQSGLILCDMHLVQQQPQRPVPHVDFEEARAPVMIPNPPEIILRTLCPVCGS